MLVPPQSPTIRLTVTRPAPNLGGIAEPLWRFALGEHRSHQVQQRPREVVLGDHDIKVIPAEMADSAAPSRPVRQRDRQGTGDEFIPLEGVAAASGVDHPALDGAIRSDLGHHDPHKPSLPLCMPESAVGCLPLRRSFSCHIPRAGEFADMPHRGYRMSWDMAGCRFLGSGGERPKTAVNDRVSGGGNLPVPPGGEGAWRR